MTIEQARTDAHEVGDISVVVPTTGRTSLSTAVSSALFQTLPPAEVIVAVDGPPSADILGVAALDHRIRLLNTSQHRGGNSARNLGIVSARCQYIAFLDDDDTWSPTKLEVQLQDLERHEREPQNEPGQFLCTTAVKTRSPTHPGSEIWPKRVIRTDESVVDYLFRARFPSVKPFVQTSTWFARTSLFTALPFDETVAIHQDYDWLIRAERIHRVRIIMNEQPLVSYWLNSAGSVAESTRWRQSLAWVSNDALPLQPRERANFVTRETHRIAINSVGSLESARVGAYAFKLGRPSFSNILLFVLRTVGALTRLAPLRRLSRSRNPAQGGE